MASVLVTVVVVLVITGFFGYLRMRRIRGLPPGPRPLPIVGNILDLPSAQVPEFQHWLKHKDKYGPISSVTVMGRTRVFIHDKKAAYDLLENMSATTSHKASGVFAYKLCGFGRFLSQLPYDNMYRRERKLMQQELGTKAATAHHWGAVEVEVGRLLSRLLARPENLFQELRSEVGAIILKTTYGYSVDYTAPDPLIALIESVMSSFSYAMQPFSRLVDSIPAIQYLPPWLPGMGFKESARRMRRANELMVNIPYSFVLRQIANGNYQPSYVSKLVQRFQQDDGNKNIGRDDEDAIKYTAGTMYAGGAHTSVITISSCILAMIMFPDVQMKAQEEIDCVIGNERLPQFKDRETLPYINSIVKETLRWFTVTPMASPHQTEEDITYGGYFIPKGSLLTPGVWWFCHDPEIYSDPHSFNPDRFLEPRNEPDPTGMFGYGRRICVGRHLADATVFLTVAQMLAVFDICKAVDEQGVEIEPTIKVSHGMISCLANFPYRIVPRDVKKADFIRSIAVDSLPDGHAKLLDEFTM